MNRPHIHRDLIIAWANGAEIEARLKDDYLSQFPLPDWEIREEKWYTLTDLDFNDKRFEYRIKPGTENLFDNDPYYHLYELALADLVQEEENLRDEFAKAVLSALYNSCATCPDAAKASYEMADAMLAERKKKNES